MVPDAAHGPAGKPFVFSNSTEALDTRHDATPERITPFGGPFDAVRDVVRQETSDRQLAMDISSEGTPLTPRPDTIPALDEATAADQELWTTMMEVATADLTQAHDHFGRVFDASDQMDLRDAAMEITIVDNYDGNGEGKLDGAVNDSTILALPRNMVEAMLAPKHRDQGAMNSTPGIRAIRATSSS